MESLYLNSKVIGAVIVGLSLVAGAYTITSLNNDREVSPQTANTQPDAPQARAAIAVSDNNQDGVEDWRDQFLDTESITVEEPTETEEYEPPKTLTGRTGIHLVERLVQSKMSGLASSSNEEIVNETANALAAESEVELYELDDIKVMEEWEDEDIAHYANALAATMISNSDPEVGYELDIMYEVTERGKEEKLEEMERLKDIYQSYRDDALKVAVPEVFAKEHLDLINTYQAIWQDLDGMSKLRADPMLTLLHLRRYEDDASGLAKALQNIYTALEPYADKFTTEDPAMIFAVFSPDYEHINN